MDQPSGVAKTVVGISPLLCAKAPTLDNAGHRVKFNNNNSNQNNNNNIFMFLKYIILTNAY